MGDVSIILRKLTLHTSLHDPERCSVPAGTALSNRRVATDAERCLGTESGYGQLVDTIFTESTFSVAAGVLDGADLASPAAAEAGRCSSIVPVISTLWPTCGVSVVSVPSSRYDLAADAPPAAPDVATADPAPAAEALVSMNGMLGAPVIAAVLAG